MTLSFRRPSGRRPFVHTEDRTEWPQKQSAWGAGCNDGGQPSSTAPARTSFFISSPQPKRGDGRVPGTSARSVCAIRSTAGPGPRRTRASPFFYPIWRTWAPSPRRVPDGCCCAGGGAAWPQTAMSRNDAFPSKRCARLGGRKTARAYAYDRSAPGSLQSGAPAGIFLPAALALLPHWAGLELAFPPLSAPSSTRAAFVRQTAISCRGGCPRQGIRFRARPLIAEC